MPRPEKLLLVCVNERPPERKECCASHGSEAIGKAFRRCLKQHNLNHLYRATTSKCLGVCSGGPHAVVMPDNVWYAGFSEADVEEIVESHLIGGKPVTRLVAAKPESPCG